MKREKITVEKVKTCLDCFHCKVSRKSIMTKGLCFCEKKSVSAEKRSNTGRKRKYADGLTILAHNGE